MRTTEQARLYGLQHLRFFAAFAVLVHHVLEEASGSPLAHVPDAVQRAGACGVDIFFVISGLVMWHTTAGFSSQTSARRFLARRLTRIVPPYWACLVVVVALAASGLAYRHLRIGATGLIESLFLLPPTTSAGMVIGVAWTLVYELYFYVICTAALCFPWQRYRVALMGALLAGVPLALAMGGATAQSRYYGSPIVVEFLGGVLLGALCTKLPRSNSFIRLMVALVCIALFYCASVASPDKATAGLPASWRWWAWGVPGLLLVAAFVHMEDTRSALSRALTSLGNASYVLYLTHGFAMIAFAKAIKSGVFHSASSLWMAAACVTVFAVALSAVLHLYVEKPLMARFQRKRTGLGQSVLT